MRRPVTPRRTDSERTGATPIAGRSGTGNGSQYRRMWRDDAQPSLPGLIRQSIANKDFLAKMAGCPGQARHDGQRVTQLSNSITLQSVLRAFILAKRH